MATETTMMGSMSVDSLDSDSDSEDEHMAGMFTAERISALSCNIGAELLVSVRYVRNQSSIVEVRVVRVRVESVHEMYMHADQIVRYNHNDERHNHFNLVMRLSKSTKSAIKAAPNLDFWFCAAETGPYRSTLETKNRDLVVHFIAISHTRPILTVSDIELILKSIVKR